MSSLFVRSAVSFVFALVLSACATVKERGIPLSEVAGWRIADVQVAYLPTTNVNLENKTTAIATRKGGPELAAPAPVDPANPDRNLIQERLQEIISQPETVAEARAQAASEVAQNFRKAFALQPSGARPVRLMLEVIDIQDVADQAVLSVKSSFVDQKSGQLLLVNEGVSHIRPSRRLQATGAFIGGGLVGVASVAVLAAVQDGGRPSPFQDVQEETALRLRTWLMKPDAERNQ
jgi:hypothetical protein